MLKKHTFDNWLALFILGIPGFLGVKFFVFNVFPAEYWGKPWTAKHYYPSNAGAWAAFALICLLFTPIYGRQNSFVKLILSAVLAGLSFFVGIGHLFGGAKPITPQDCNSQDLHQVHGCSLEIKSLGFLDSPNREVRYGKPEAAICQNAIAGKNETCPVFLVTQKNYVCVYLPRISAGTRETQIFSQDCKKSVFLRAKGMQADENAQQDLQRFEQEILTYFNKGF